MSRKMSASILLGICLLASGCDSDGADHADRKDPNDTSNPGDMGEAEGWLVRTATPDSEFAPAAFEDVLDDLTDSLNATEQVTGMQLAFVPKTLVGFFELAILGANRAHAELGALGNVVSPTVPETDDAPSQADQQIAILSGLITSSTVGIGIAPMNTDLVPSIDAAVDSGAAVITFDGDISDSKRQLYIGTNNSEAGKTGGETMAALLGALTGTVIILGNTDESWEDGYNRTMEAAAVLEAAGNTVVPISTNWNDRPSNLAEIQEIMETAETSVVGCLGVFSTSFLCADAAIAEGIENDIELVAFDFEPQTIEYLEDGIISATHVQRSYYMGYMIPYLLYAVNTIGLDETKAIVSDLMVDEVRIDTGLDVIAADRLEAYNAFVDELGSLM